MKIQTPKYADKLDIILCNLECYDKRNRVIAEIKERVLFCAFRGLYSYSNYTNYTKHINRDVLKKTKIIKLVPVKIIGAANTN